MTLTIKSAVIALGVVTRPTLPLQNWAFITFKLVFCCGMPFRAYTGLLIQGVPERSHMSFWCEVFKNLFLNPPSGQWTNIAGGPWCVPQINDIKVYYDSLRLGYQS